MKRKFRALLTFLRPYQEDKVIFYWNYYDNVIEWNWGNSNKSELPQNILDLATEICENFEDQIKDTLYDNCYTETDYYQIEMHVDPTTSTAIIKMKAEYYTSQAETYERELTNSDLEDYFKKTGVEIIEARYSGGGDSGDIDSIRIDGEDTDIDWNSDDQDKKLIWDTLYDNLENAFCGWEIDDGSAGTIELSENMQIIISHEWNMREMEYCDDEIKITMESFEN